MSYIILYRELCEDIHTILWKLTAQYAPYLQNVKQSLYRANGFQEVEAPKFQDSWHVQVVRLSALHTGCLYPPRNTPGTHFY
jgi:hypothetical protein